MPAGLLVLWQQRSLGAVQQIILAVDLHTTSFGATFGLSASRVLFP
jgi:hypothetical protein